MFNFSLVPLKHAEIDALSSYALPGDKHGEFHVACTTKAMVLVSFDANVAGGSCQVKQAWQRDMKSRAWHVVASVVPSRTTEPAFFTAREDGHFHAYGINGTPSWSHDFSATISEFKLYSDPFTGERVLVIPSIDKTLRMLTAASGRLLWGDTFQSGVNVVDQCLLADKESHVIVAGGNDYTLRCYVRKSNEKPGAYKMAWFHKFESYVRDVSISPSGHVAAVADDGFVKVLSVKDGKVAWRHEHNSFAWKCKILPGVNKVISTSYQLPLSVDESGEKMGNPGVVTCHDLDTGKLVWTTKPEDGINVNAWDAHENRTGYYFVVGTTAGDVIVIDAGTGMVLQKFNAGHLVNHVEFVTMDAGHIGIIGCQESDHDSLFVGIQTT